MKFPISDEEPVMTTSYVVDNKFPVLYVAHDRDEESETGGSWQFHSGKGDYESSKLRLVMIKTILDLDTSLLEVADLPIGFGAHRTAPGQPWSYQRED